MTSQQLKADKVCQLNCMISTTCTSPTGPAERSAQRRLLFSADIQPLRVRNAQTVHSEVITQHSDWLCQAILLIKDRF